MENKLKYDSYLTVRAERDLTASFTWYEQQQSGLGSRFIEEVLSRIHTIEHNPELFSTKNKSYREAGMPTFPYIIVYRFYKRKKIIRIFTIFHTSQNPKKKYRQAQ